MNGNVPGLAAGGGLKVVSCPNTPELDKSTKLSKKPPTPLAASPC